MTWVLRSALGVVSDHRASLSSCALGEHSLPAGPGVMPAPDVQVTAGPGPQKAARPSQAHPEARSSFTPRSTYTVLAGLNLKKKCNVI